MSEWFGGVGGARIMRREGEREKLSDWTSFMGEQDGNGLVMGADTISQPGRGGI